jgi:hypothetical protein
MSDENYVESFQSEAQRLLSKISRRIHQDGAPRMFDDD